MSYGSFRIQNNDMAISENLHLGDLDSLLKMSVNQIGCKAFCEGLPSFPIVDMNMGVSCGTAAKQAELKSNETLASLSFEDLENYWDGRSRQYDLERYGYSEKKWHWLMRKREDTYGTAHKFVVQGTTGDAYISRPDLSKESFFDPNYAIPNPEFYEDHERCFPFWGLIDEQSEAYWAPGLQNGGYLFGEDFVGALNNLSTFDYAAINRAMPGSIPSFLLPTYQQLNVGEFLARYGPNGVGMPDPEGLVEDSVEENTLQNIKNDIRGAMAEKSLLDVLGICRKPDASLSEKRRKRTHSPEPPRPPPPLPQRGPIYLPEELIPSVLAEPVQAQTIAIQPLVSVQHASTRPEPFLPYEAQTQSEPFQSYKAQASVQPCEIQNAVQLKLPSPGSFHFYEVPVIDQQFAKLATSPQSYDAPIVVQETPLKPMLKEPVTKKRWKATATKNITKPKNTPANRIKKNQTTKECNAPGKKRKNVNAFIAYRMYTQAFIQADHQMTTSGIIKDLWAKESEPNKAQWTKIAHLYSAKRNLDDCSQLDLRLYLGDLVIQYGIGVGQHQRDEQHQQLHQRLVYQKPKKTPITNDVVMT